MRGKYIKKDEQIVEEEREKKSKERRREKQRTRNSAGWKTRLTELDEG